MTTIRRPGPRARRVLLTLFGLVLLGGLAYGAARWLFSGNQATTPDLNYSLIQPRRGEMQATVNASGTMQPREVLRLNFGTTGVVVQIRAEVGKQVQRGDVLARLDTSELDLAVEQAQARLAQDEAAYEQLLAGATPAEVEQARAQLEQAESQLRQTQGTVTNEDIAAARARLEQARAALQRLESGADPNDLAAARAALERAQATLETQRASLSAAKTQAESRVEQAANALRDVQAEYSSVYWEIREAERELNNINQQLWQDLKDREERALRAVDNAEQDLEQARVAAEEAREAERAGIAAAEADVRSAQASLDDLLEGADSDELAAARAQVADAEASLARLLGDERQGSVAAAQASVEQARARLDDLTSEPRDVDLASAAARIQQSQAALEQAQIEASKATLRAPINGTVAEVNLNIGEAPGQPAVVLADLSGFYVDVTVDEIDVASLAPEQPVELTLDALPELQLTGSVETISPLSLEEASVTSYQVRISTRPDDKRVRAGMSTNADIIVNRTRDALVVPRRAVRVEEGTLFVDVPTDQTLCAATPETWPIQPDLRAIEVAAGLRNDELIEITEGDITEQTCVYVEGFDPRLSPFGGPPPGR
jgi:HlyD family secretion protein